MATATRGTGTKEMATTRSTKEMAATRGAKEMAATRGTKEMAWQLRRRQRLRRLLMRGAGRRYVMKCNTPSGDEWAIARRYSQFVELQVSRRGPYSCNVLWRIPAAAVS